MPHAAKKRCCRLHLQGWISFFNSYDTWIVGHTTICCLSCFVVSQNLQSQIIFKIILMIVFLLCSMVGASACFQIVSNSLIFSRTLFELRRISSFLDVCIVWSGALHANGTVHSQVLCSWNRGNRGKLFCCVWKYLDSVWCNHIVIFQYLESYGNYLGFNSDVLLYKIS